MLYFAYGSNLNIGQMKYRCPNARPTVSCRISNHRLTFNYYADIIPSKDNYIYGGLWEITSRCERKLDYYEGISANLYTKKYFSLEGKKVLYYDMTKKNPNIHHYNIPTEGYINTIIEGYKDFNIPLVSLIEAIEESVRMNEEEDY